MSRSVRNPARPREARTPRQRVQHALAQAAALRGDQPEDRRTVVVRAADLTAVMDDCGPEGDDQQ